VLDEDTAVLLFSVFMIVGAGALVVAGAAAVRAGTGTALQPVANDLAGTPVLLVNPRVPVPTGPVFKGWDGIDRGALPEGALRIVATEGRNDLEAPALAICPQIGVVLDALRGTDAWLVRMSGSGATCFALFATIEERDAAAAQIAGSQPEWWQMCGRLR